MGWFLEALSTSLYHANLRVGVFCYSTTNAISNLTLSCICLQGREFKHIIHAFMYHMTYCALFPQRQQQLHDGDGNWVAENLAPP